MRFGQIYRRPITQSTRTVCYDHPLCVDDTLVEGDEMFRLSIVDRSLPTVNVTIDSVLGITNVIIIDNDGI